MTGERPDQEPAFSRQDPRPDSVAKKAMSSRQALISLKRDLSEKEFSTPAVQKLLVDDLYRLEAENESLASFRDKFHQCDKRVGVLEEKLKVSIGQELISGGCIAFGGAAIGYGLTSEPAAGVLLTFGCGIVVIGVIAKVVFKS